MSLHTYCTCVAIWAYVHCPREWHQIGRFNIFSGSRRGRWHDACTVHSFRRSCQLQHVVFTYGLFTKERITFRKLFRIAIHFLIGFVNWTTHVHKHCKCHPNHEQELRTARWYFVPTAQSALIDPCMASARISNMRMHESRSERALRSHVLRIRLSTQITIQNALFSRFKSLIWKSCAFTKGKIRKESESCSETAFGTWFVPWWTGQSQLTI